MMIGGAADKPCVLVAAARADWEPAVLAALSQARMVVLRRCVDIVDLLGTASAGAADVAVVAARRVVRGGNDDVATIIAVTVIGIAMVVALVARAVAAVPRIRRSGRGRGHRR